MDKENWKPPAHCYSNVQSEVENISPLKIKSDMVRQGKNLRNNINFIKAQEEQDLSKRHRRPRGGKTRTERRKAAKAREAMGKMDEPYFADTGCSPVKRSDLKPKTDLLMKESVKIQSYKVTVNEGMIAPTLNEVKIYKP